LEISLKDAAGAGGAAVSETTRYQVQVSSTVRIRHCPIRKD
jgi:hypothetical protein